MPKKKRTRKPAHRTGAPRAGRAGRAAREPDLLSTVREAVSADDPTSLLTYASTLLAAVQPDRRSLRQPPDEGPTLRDLIDSLLDVDLVETSALLLCLAELAGDDVLRRRVVRQVLARNHALPAWLLALRAAEPTECLQVRHVLGDGDNVMAGVRLTDGRELTAMIYIDHNMGTLVKDAFVVPSSPQALADRMRELADDPDTTIAGLDPADARTRVTAAIELGAITIPPFETDTWPGCRALVEWAVAKLPDGGTGYERPEWDDQDLAALTERFFASPFGSALDDDDHRSLLESLLWFGTDYGPGDPLRWSPTAVEILLLDWLPRKIVAEAEYLAQAPELLRAFIRFCHAERGIRAALTDQTLAAVDEDEPDYQQIIRTPRPQGPEALIAAMQAYERGER